MLMIDATIGVKYVCVCVFRYMMETAAVLQSWSGCVAVSCPALSTQLAMSFTSNYALTAASTREAFLLHIAPVLSAHTEHYKETKHTTS